mmetsp:Transcript_48292/g.154648  ORF Transcript_48292/g.154648 Transcript_48292/m.154648 type:complete len:200 (-) Transcript_48292:174-773(-)
MHGAEEAPRHPPHVEALASQGEGEGADGDFVVGRRRPVEAPHRAHPRNLARLDARLLEGPHVGVVVSYHHPPAAGLGSNQRGERGPCPQLYHAAPPRLQHLVLVGSEVLCKEQGRRPHIKPDHVPSSAARPVIVSGRGLHPPRLTLRELDAEGPDLVGLRLGPRGGMAGGRVVAPGNLIRRQRGFYLLPYPLHGALPWP